MYKVYISIFGLITIFMIFSIMMFLLFRTELKNKKALSFSSTFYKIEYHEKEKEPIKYWFHLILSLFSSIFFFLIAMAFFILFYSNNFIQNI
jgi:hypothetical protein